MKKILFVIATVGLFTACQKKANRTSCYACVITDSVASNIPALVTAATTQPAEHCEFTQDMINYYIKTHDKPDTLYNHNDTLEIQITTTTCAFDY